MDNKLLLGLGRWMLPIPAALWQRGVARDARHLGASLGFMSPEHHWVRNLAVREIMRTGQALAAPVISQVLGLTPARTEEILEDLERRMTFLFRDAQGAVSWAYPVTAEETPHRVEFETGEQVHAA
jgi:hypothetical protein